MDNEFIKIISPVAGLGGIAFAVFLSLFHSFIRKLKPVALAQDQWFRITRLFLILTWAIGVIGIIVWAIKIQDNSEVAHKHAKIKSQFIKDVTVPDGWHVAVDQKIIKKWAVRNVSGYPWKDMHIERVGINNGEGLLRSEDRGSLPQILPDDTAEIIVTMFAPSIGGSTIAFWKIVDKNGDYPFKNQNPIYSQLIVDDKNSFAEDINCPNGSIFRTNDEFTKRWLIKNTTNKKISNAFLRREAGGLLESEDLKPIKDIPPGESQEIELKIVTPSDPTTTTTHWTVVDSKGNDLFKDKNKIYMTAIIKYRPEEIFGAGYQRCDMK